ncbi:MAG: peptidoglycan-binding domain-containing protein [Candidatus Gracilibacteria bacterium]|jgi:hypothetical protein
MKTKTQLFGRDVSVFAPRFIYKLTSGDLPEPYSCVGKSGEKIPESENVYKEKVASLARRVGADLGEMSEGLALQRLSSAFDPVKVERDERGRYLGMRCPDGSEKRVSYLRDKVDVLVLQVLLKKLYEKYPKVKYLNPGNVDGRWGTMTKDSLRTFQTAAGVKDDGEFGPETLAALKEVFEGNVTLDFSGKKPVRKLGVDLKPASRENKVENKVVLPYELNGQILTVKLNKSETPVEYRVIAPLDFTISVGKDSYGKDCVTVTDAKGVTGWFKFNTSDVLTYGPRSYDNGGKKSVWDEYNVWISEENPSEINIDVIRDRLIPRRYPTSEYPSVR